MQKKSEKRALFENTIAFGVGTIGAKVIMFFLLPVYTTYMTTAELGIAELIVSMVSLLLPLASLSITSALLRFALAIDCNKKQAFAVSTFVTLVGALITSAAIYFIPFGFSSLNEWKGYLCLLLFADSMRRNFSVFSKALDKIKIFTADNIVYTLMLFACNLFLLVNRHRATAGYIEAMIISDFCSIIFLTVVGRLYQFFEFRKLDSRLLKDMVLFSVPLIIEAMSWWITNSSDRYILEFIMDEDAVGVYSVANKIPLLLTTFFSVFLQAWSLSSISAFEKHEDIGFYDNVWKLYCFLAFFGATVLIAVTKPLMNILVGAAFSGAWIYVPFLIIAGAANQLYGFFSNIYIAVKKNVSVMLITMTAAIVNIVLNFTTIPYWGIQGAAFSTMVTYIAVLIYYLFSIRRCMRITLDLPRLTLGGVILTVVTASVLCEKVPVILSLVGVILQMLLYRDTIKIVWQKAKMETKRLIRQRNS